MPRAARQEASPSEVAPDIKLVPPQTEHTPETPGFIDLFTPGELEEISAADGKKHEAVTIGQHDDVGVVKFETGQVLPVTKQELRARERAELQLESLDEAFDGAIDSVMKAHRFSKAETERVKAVLMKRRGEMIYQALKEQQPEQSLVTAIGTMLANNEKIASLIAAKQKELSDTTREQAQLSILALKRELMEARQKAEEVRKTNDRRGYMDAMTNVYAIERKVDEARLKLYPRADEEQRKIIALETLGAVKPEPDELYDEGMEAVNVRIDELFDERAAATKAGNVVAWQIAETELKRHWAMLPIVEKAEELELIDRRLEKRMADLLGKAEEKRKLERARIVERHRYWHNIAESLEEKTEEMLTKLQQMSDARSFLVDGGLMSEEDYEAEKETIANKVLTYIDDVRNAEREITDLRGEQAEMNRHKGEIIFDDETHRQLNEKLGREATLVRQLREMYADEQSRDRVMDVVKRLLKSGKMRDVTKKNLEDFVANPVEPEQKPEPSFDDEFNKALSGEPKNTLEVTPLEPQIESSPQLNPFPEEFETDNFKLDLEPEPIPEEFETKDFKLDLEPESTTVKRPPKKRLRKTKVLDNAAAEAPTPTPPTRTEAPPPKLDYATKPTSAALPKQNLAKRVLGKLKFW